MPSPTFKYITYLQVEINGVRTYITSRNININPDYISGLKFWYIVQILSTDSSGSTTLVTTSTSTSLNDIYVGGKYPTGSAVPQFWGSVNTMSDHYEFTINMAGYANVVNSGNPVPAVFVPSFDVHFRSDNSKIDKN